jgi:putative ABC transport system permease protein
MEPILADVRVALRRLWRAPGFTIFAVASLAAGIGVSTAIYSAVRTLVGMPAGVPDERTLVAVTTHRSRTAVMSWVDFEDLHAQPTSASAIGAAAAIRTALGTAAISRTVIGEAVSGAYFSVVGVTPRLGRLIDARDEAAAAHVVVVSEGFWRGALNGDAAIVGHSVRLGGSSFDVIGVVAGSFHGLNPFASGAVWVPATAVRANPGPFEMSAREFDRRGERAFSVWARLRPGAAVSQFASEAAVIGTRFDAAYPDTAGGPTLVVRPREWSAAAGLRDDQDSEALRTIIFMIMSALVVVLLIACTNLANLSLARGTARAQETAVRAALGGSRWRLVREQVIESVLIVAAGGGAAAFVLFRLVDYFTTDLPFGRGLTTIAFRPEVDTTVLAEGLTAAVVAVLVFGLWPAVASTGSDVRLQLGAGIAATPPRWRFHRNLIAWQVCGSVALLLVAVMSTRAISGPGVLAAHPNYENLGLVQIDFRLNGIDDARARATVDALVTAGRQQTTLQRVAASNGSPSSIFGTPMNVGTPDDPTGARSRHRLTAMTAVTPAFLDALGLPLARGRGFTDQDHAAAARVAIVTEQLAKDLYRTTDVVGRELRVGPYDSRGPLDAVTIVGVARDISTMDSLRPDRIVFVPLTQHFEGRAPVMLVARAADTAAAVATLRSVLRQVDPLLAPSAAGRAEVLLAGPLFLFRVISLLAASLGGLALILAMAGLFGVLSHVVERRTREIGIRLAIGADRRDVVGMVLRDGLRPVFKGLVLGLVIGLGVRIVMRGQVFTTIAAWDPVEFTVLPAIFVCAALVASWLPAARASRVDPNVALRDL